MTAKEKKRSYERYKQWQDNKLTYRSECIAYGILYVIGFYFILFHWGNGVLFALKHWQTTLLGLALGFGLIAIMRWLFSVLHNKYKKHKVKLQVQKKVLNLHQIAKEAGAKNINVDLEKGNISFTIPSEKSDDVFGQFENSMKNTDMKLSINHTKADHPQDKHIKEADKMENRALKSTEQGYINRNNQLNKGRSNERGTDNNQWFYYMECLNCGKEYKANGSDIFHRKCPVCQGGRP